MSIDDILARLRAADRALAMVRGGTSELEQLRVATGELLVAVHGLAGLQAAGGLGGDGPAAPASRVNGRRRGALSEGKV